MPRLPHISNQAAGVLLALGGALLFSTKAVIVKLAYQYEVDSITLLFLRMLFALPFYLATLLTLNKTQRSRLNRIPPKLWIGLLAAGTFGYYLSSWLDFVGLQYIDASVERLILFVYPTFVALIAYFFLHEKINRIQGYALAVSYLGLIFVFGPNLDAISISDDFWKGAVLILACAVTFAAFYVLTQWLVTPFGVKAFTALSMISACIIVCIHYGISSAGEYQLFDLSPEVYIYAIIMAIFATVLPSFLVNMAISRLGAIRMAIISSVGPFSTITLAYFFLGETLELEQIFGALFIVAGVTIISVERRRNKPL